jgi:hypothetical protein
MDLFTREDLKTLLAQHPSPCVSLFMPAHRGGSEEDPIRWRKHLAEAETGQYSRQEEDVAGEKGGRASVEDWGGCSALADPACDIVGADKRRRNDNSTGVKDAFSRKANCLQPSDVFLPMSYTVHPAAPKESRPSSSR